MPLFIEPEAEEDIVAARDWYELQRQGLGDDFELCLEAGLQIAEKKPKAFQKVYKSIRRVLIRRFPYLIFFVEQSGTVVVIAVFHVRQNPADWKKRRP
jgi:toxin ParE1/3/4